MSTAGIRAAIRSARPYRGHPRYGLLPVAVRSSVHSVSEIPKHRQTKISFKNKYLYNIPECAVLRSQFAASDARRSNVAEKLALGSYEQFDAARREAAQLAADAEDMVTLEQVERRLESKGKGK